MGAMRTREVVDTALAQLCGRDALDHRAVLDTCVEAVLTTQSIDLPGPMTRRVRNVAELLLTMDHPDLPVEMRARAAVACQIAVLRLLPA